MLALLCAAQVTLLPVRGGEAPRGAAQAAQAALTRGLPRGFVRAPLDLEAAQERLDDAGPGCREDLACLCATVPLAPGAQALELSLRQMGKGLSADLRLLAPCEGVVLGRRAAVIEKGAAALEQFVAQAARDLLRAHAPAPRPEETTAGAAPPQAKVSAPPAGRAESPPARAGPPAANH